VVPLAVRDSTYASSRGTSHTNASLGVLIKSKVCGVAAYLNAYP